VSGRAACAEPDNFNLEVQTPVVRSCYAVGETCRDHVVGLHDVLLEQPRRAECAAGFFVEREVQLDRATQRRCARLQCAERVRIRREVGFRNGDAAAVHRAITDLGAVGIGGPTKPRRYDVAVCVERDRRPVAESLAHDEVRHGDHSMGTRKLCGYRIALDLKAETFEQRGGALGDCGAIPRRIIGRNPDELSEEPRLVRAFAQQMRVDRLRRAIPHFGAGNVAKLSMKRSKTRADSAASSAVIDSSGLWLMPSLQRTNSMPISASSTIAIPS